MKSHHHHHHDHRNISTTILYICLIINVAFVVAESIMGWISNSTSLLSDAGHNLSDTLGLLLSLIAIQLERAGANNCIKISRRVTFVNALLLLAAVAAILTKSFDKILNPSTIESHIVIYTAATAIVINGVTAYLLMRGDNANINIRAAYLHALTDTLVSVGVVASGIVIHYTHLYIIDPIISLVISVAIAIPALRLLLHILQIIKNE
ncbi:MAG: cation transporter [Bacteroidales bacterium]|nr:cation transporter [Bacteroidales bacterium]MBP3670660.1 cation transporter [Bacteroidaceae bacterium]